MALSAQLATYCAFNKYVAVKKLQVQYELFENALSKVSWETENKIKTKNAGKVK